MSECKHSIVLPDGRCYYCGEIVPVAPEDQDEDTLDTPWQDPFWPDYED